MTMERLYGLYVRYGMGPEMRLALRLAVIGVAVAASIIGSGGTEIAFAGEDD